MPKFRISFSNRLTTPLHSKTLIYIGIIGIIFGCFAAGGSLSIQDEVKDINFQSSQTNSSIYDQELAAFEKDRLKPRRRKRYIYLNVQSNLDVGFLVVIPITVVLPSMSNLFNKWRRRRSIDNLEEEPIFQDHHLVEPHLQKISSYFQLLDIPEHNCQVRAICEFSANPEAFYPLSDMILGRLHNALIPTELIYDGKAGNASTSLFRRFNDAAEEGQIMGTEGCLKRHGSSCKYSMDKLLSMNFLRVWFGAKKHFGLKVQENFEL